MSAKSNNKAIFNSLLSNRVSGSLAGYVFAKNGILRANNRAMVKRSKKKFGSINENT